MKLLLGIEKAVLRRLTVFKKVRRRAPMNQPLRSPVSAAGTRHLPTRARVIASGRGVVETWLVLFGRRVFRDQVLVAREPAGGFGSVLVSRSSGHDVEKYYP